MLSSVFNPEHKMYVQYICIYLEMITKQIACISKAIWSKNSHIEEKHSIIVLYFFLDLHLTTPGVYYERVIIILLS